MANATATPTAPVTTTPAPTTNGEQAAERRSFDLYKDVTTAQEAVKGMEKGRCRVFNCTIGGKTYVVGAVHGAAAGYGAYLTAGGTVDEVGAKVRSAKPVGVDGIMAAVNALPEGERKAILDQLKALAGKK